MPAEIYDQTRNQGQQQAAPRAPRNGLNPNHLLNAKPSDINNGVNFGSDLPPEKFAQGREQTPINAIPYPAKVDYQSLFPAVTLGPLARLRASAPAPQQPLPYQSQEDGHWPSPPPPPTPQIPLAQQDDRIYGNEEEFIVSAHNKPALPALRSLPQAPSYLQPPQTQQYQRVHASTPDDSLSTDEEFSSLTPLSPTPTPSRSRQPPSAQPHQPTPAHALESLVGTIGQVDSQITELPPPIPLRRRPPMVPRARLETPPPIPPRRRPPLVVQAKPETPEKTTPPVHTPPVHTAPRHDVVLEERPKWLSRQSPLLSPLRRLRSRALLSQTPEIVAGSNEETVARPTTGAAISVSPPSQKHQEDNHGDSTLSPNSSAEFEDENPSHQLPQATRHTPTRLPSGQRTPSYQKQHQLRQRNRKPICYQPSQKSSSPLARGGSATPVQESPTPVSRLEEEASSLQAEIKWKKSHDNMTIDEKMALIDEFLNEEDGSGMVEGVGVWPDLSTGVGDDGKGDAMVKDAIEELDKLLDEFDPEKRH